MPLFTLGAFAIIFDEQGRVLLCHRRDFDAWNLPGGGVESRELPTEAVIREVREETGKQVQRIDDAIQSSREPIFRLQTAPSTQEMLKQLRQGSAT